MIPGNQVLILSGFYWHLAFLEAEISPRTSELYLIVILLKCKYAFPALFMKRIRLSTPWNAWIPSTFDSDVFSRDEASSRSCLLLIFRGNFISVFVCLHGIVAFLIIITWLCSALTLFFKIYFSSLYIIIQIPWLTFVSWLYSTPRLSHIKICC